MATLWPALAQYRGYEDHMDGGWGWAMVALMAFAIIVAAALVYWIVRSGQTQSRATAEAPPAQTPQQILDRRLAEGDISPEEYRERRSLLGAP